MFWLLGAAVVIVGALLATQPLINARIAGAAGHPVYGAMFSVFVSTIALLAAAIVLRLPAPDLRALTGLPTWSWTGGVIGACVVLAGVVVTPRLGAATTVMLFITGQMAASLLLDHYGWLGVPERPLDLMRVLGVLCLMAGVALIRWH
jgi:bacterial/archaeal transporter family-2 protein